MFTGRDSRVVRRACLALFLTFVAPLFAATPAEDFFTTQVRPVLQQNCFKCHSHSAEKIKGGLVLDSLDGLLTGGDSGPTIVPGDVEKSLFIKAVRYTEADLQMPPKDKKLSAPQIALLEVPHRKKADELILPKFPEETLALIEKPVAQRTPLEHQIAELAYRQVTYEHYRMKVTGADKEKHVALLKKLASFDEFQPAPLPQALLVTDVGAVAPPVFIPKKAPTPVEPGLLTLLEEKPMTILPVPGLTNSTGRRTALAQWLTEPENPLTTRVIVNRVWQYHFGHGLSRTASDFGRLGEMPSHPELLDWLARRFVAEGWSLKKLHRLIVTSATYRQASDSVISKSVISEASSSRRTDLLITDSLITSAKQLDPENRLLWHGPMRRLDAEQIRDTILAVTGELQSDAGGPASDAFKARRSISPAPRSATRPPRPCNRCCSSTASTCCNARRRWPNG